MPCHGKADRQIEGVESLIQLAAPTWSYLTFVAFMAFFLGYALARRSGRKDGFHEGLQFAPLELRRESWAKGRCVICGNAGDYWENAGEGEEKEEDTHHGRQEPSN